MSEEIEQTEEIEQLKETVAELTEELNMYKESEPAPKKRKTSKKVDLLQQLKLSTLSPSTVTWDLMEQNLMLPPFEDFLQDLKYLEKYDVDSDPNDLAQKIDATMKLVCRHSDGTSEGFQVLLIGILLAYVTSCLDQESTLRYKFEVFPLVYSDNADHRRDKKTDYILARVFNRRTITIIEVKQSLSSRLTKADSKSLAQLFYEACLRCEKECCHYEDIICILANHDIWHFFTVDCSRKLLNFKQHLVVRDPTAHVVTETMKYLCSKFTEIPSASSQQVPL